MSYTQQSHSPSESLSSHDTPQRVKKRRLHGACDACRKKKVKCDSAQMPNNECTNCRQADIHCSHDIPRQPKKSEKQQEYIIILERKIEKLRHFIQSAYPNQDIDALVDASFDDTLATASSSTNSPTSSPNYPEFNYPVPQAVSTSMKSQTHEPGPEDPSELDDLAHIGLSEHLRHLSLSSVDDRYLGPSSVFMFAKNAATVRKELTGAPSKPDVKKFRRPLFWDVHPWEMAFATLQEPAYMYPEQELLLSLVKLYFEKVNQNFPLLHQPTFRRMLEAGQHHYDSAFGMTVLLVCALGARYSQDPRVLMPGDSDAFSAGWRYFCQVPIHRNYLYYKCSIYDLQYYVLALLYFNGTSVPNTAWHVMGLGIRFALEKGAHRRKQQSQKPTAETELMKRAFWCLLSLDRYLASFLGRPCMIQDEDFDVEYPIECDDEYWETEDPNHAFKQPPGKPCTISAFVHNLKLCETLGFALRTLYSTKKSKVLSGQIGDEWEKRIVSELDASMARWKDNLPYFLRWDPDMEESIFFHQSVSLHATYYYIQILIHRPFLTKKSPLSFPALAMCTNAARACAHMLEASITRGIRYFPNMIMAAVSAGVVITLNLWGNQQSGIMDPAKEMADLERCINFLKACENRWHMAGRMRDMLNEVASLTDYQPTINKRRRDEPRQASIPNGLPPPPSTVNPPGQMPMAQNCHSVPPSTNFMPGFAPNATSLMNMHDWLLLAQMGYMQANSDNSHHRSQHFDTELHTPIPILHPSTSTARHASAMHINGDGSDLALTQDDLFALWSDIPVTFTSSDQWDAYLTTMQKI